MTATLLLVDDDPLIIQVLGRTLAPLGEVRFATSGADALRLAAATAPDVILLDAELPDVHGFAVCAALKDNPELSQIPVIFVTPHRDEPFELAGFSAGAADFITKPFSLPLVLARVQAQLHFKRMADQLRLSATMDALTGVANRRQFDDALLREWLRVKRAREAISLIMVDVDHFKKYNDRYGHPMGDQCLRSVAQALRTACLRPGDLVARYGGEEFALLLPQTSGCSAQHVAERLLQAVQALALPHAASLVGPYVTVSAGIAHYGDQPEDWLPLSAGIALVQEELKRPSPRGLTEAADRALYSAKQAGRAQACLAPLAENTSGSHGDELLSSQRIVVAQRAV